jgi:hypothetical protein
MITFDNVEVPPSLSLSLWQVQEQQESSSPLRPSSPPHD